MPNERNETPEALKARVDELEALLDEAEGVAASYEEFVDVEDVFGEYENGESKDFQGKVSAYRAKWGIASGAGAPGLCFASLLGIARARFVDRVRELDKGDLQELEDDEESLAGLAEEVADAAFFEYVTTDSTLLQFLHSDPWIGHSDTWGLGRKYEATPLGIAQGVIRESMAESLVEEYQEKKPKMMDALNNPPSS